MRAGNAGPTFLSNNAGGILGGISTGDPVVVRCFEGELLQRHGATITWVTLAARIWAKHRSTS
mgnify:CR=1 FL=1